MSEATELMLLVRARELLERGWCQGPFAKDGDGKPCRTSDARATQFCGAGALMRASYELTGEHPFSEVSSSKKLYSTVSERIDAYVQGLSSDDGLVVFSEEPGRTQAEVVELFRNVAQKLHDEIERRGVEE